MATIGGELKIFSPKLKGDMLVYDFISADAIVVNIAQGRTLPGVVLDLASFFEFGSYYTAISRV
jgi:hypothetical protein